jgi:GNAT superfamily N-acetyltransferase
METSSDIAAGADRSFVGSYEKLAEHQKAGQVRRSGQVFAFVSHLPIPIFNGAIALELVPVADLDSAIDWLDDEAAPYSIWIREEFARQLSRPLGARGFERRPWLMPGMVIGARKAPPAAPGVSVSAVEGAAGLDEHIRVVAGSGVPEAVVRQMYAKSFATDPDVRLFTAYLDGDPVGTSLALRTGDVAGVYAVGTEERARRRGVGTAATWAAVEAGFDWGCPTVVLQSSEMGFGVYSAMGFEVVVRYAMFRRPAA